VGESGLQFRLTHDDGITAVITVYSGS
jgi:hypothetical protein